MTPEGYGEPGNLGIAEVSCSWDHHWLQHVCPACEAVV